MIRNITLYSDTNRNFDCELDRLHQIRELCDTTEKILFKAKDKARKSRKAFSNCLRKTTINMRPKGITAFPDEVWMWTYDECLRRLVDATKN